MIIDKTVKTTKNNTLMAFITIEDLYGTVEVTVFPRDYERNKHFLEVDSKVFVRGRADVQEERAGKLICQKIIPFDSVSCELWIRFQNKAEFVDKEQLLYDKLMEYDGHDSVFIYLNEEKQIKMLPRGKSIDARRVLRNNILKEFGEDSVAIKEKSIEK